MDTPYISNLQRFSLDDGPGIRTTVFFKGCNLHCAWCHNPECISPGPALQFNQTACASCGKCAVVCPQGAHRIAPDGSHQLDRALCTACGRCAYECPHGALKLLGSQITPEELLKQLLKDRSYYLTSGGGVTFSGGEPMLYPDYLARLLPLCRQEGLHTAIDTAGCVPFSHFERVLPWVDLFLFDVKFRNESRHLAATGVSNRTILENLDRLTREGGKVYIRVPVVPPYHDLDELDRIAAFLAGLEGAAQIQLIQLLPYHSYGVGKYATLGETSRTADLQPPSDEWMAQGLSRFTARRLPARIS